MSNYTIERVELEGIHGRYSLDISFNSSLNILYGENGTGKSTLIHIIANVANRDFIRFAFLDFKRIKLTYSNEAYICITQEEMESDRLITVRDGYENFVSFSQREAFDATREMESDRYDSELAPDLINRISNFVEKYDVPVIKTSYFPAFRTMLEAWSSQTANLPDSYIRKLQHRTRRNPSSERATSFSRNLFGQFLPTINYPSPIDIEQRLNEEIRHCQIRIANYESSVFSDSFIKVFSALLEGKDNSYNSVNAENLIEEISQLTNESNNNKLGALQDDSNTYRELRRLVSINTNSSRDLQSSASGALVVYRDALKERKAFQQEAFEAIDIYFDVVNSFLNKKKLDYRLEKKRRAPLVGLKFPDDTWSSIKVMSSGERQLLTMLYAVNRMSENSAVLIDEPEISLHIDWQEDLLSKMMEQLGKRQIIVCTHSPAIASDFKEHMTEVVPVFNDISRHRSDIMTDDDEEEDY